MNSIITLPKLVELLRAASADIDPKLCDDFVPAFTALVAETLKHDDFVKIKGLGTFRKEVTPDKTKVTFVPDREIADVINAPFVFFAPEELSDGVALSDLETPAPATEAPEAAPGDGAASEPEMAEEPKLVEVAADEPEVEAEVASEPEAPKVEPSEPKPSEPEAPEAVEPASVPEVSEPKAAPAPTPEPKAAPAPTPEPKAAPAPEPEATPAPAPKATPAPEARNTDNNVASDEPEVEYRATPPRQGMVPVRPQASKHNAYAEAAANIRVEAYDDEPAEKKESTPWFLIALFYVVGMLVGFGLGFFGHDYISGYTSTISTGPDEEDLDLIYADEPSDSTVEAAPDTIVPAAPQAAAPAPAKEDTAPAPEAPKQGAPAAQEVYVTVKPGSGLFDIAKKQYGHKEYWVYIYMENTDKIKNPNNVSAGLKLRIPPKEKYDVSKTDEAANLKAAKAKGAEVLKRF